MAKSIYASKIHYWLAVEVRRRAFFAIHTSKRAADGRVRVLVLVEGLHDIDFLRSISLVLRKADSQLPNLIQMEQNQELIFIPTGGRPKLWSERLVALDLPEMHLLKGGASYVTHARRQIAATINRRARCQAFVTSHRSLENYLHPRAIDEVSGLTIAFGGTEDIPALVAQGMYEAMLPITAWDELPLRIRKRGCEKAKKWLNTDAVEAMTPALLAERDLHGEVSAWLRTIAELAKGN